MGQKGVLSSECRWLSFPGSVRVDRIIPAGETKWESYFHWTTIGQTKQQQDKENKECFGWEDSAGRPRE